MDLKYLVTIVFSLVIALGHGFGQAVIESIGYGFGRAVVEGNQQNRSTQIESQDFGYAEYLRLNLGMSIAEVEAILGRGTVISRSGTTETFLWENTDGSGVTAVFKSNRLEDFKQSKLK